MRKFYDIICLLLPWNVYRIMKRGAQVTKAFRQEYHRDPTDEELKRLSEQVDREVFGQSHDTRFYWHPESEPLR